MSASEVCPNYSSGMQPSARSPLSDEHNKAEGVDIQELCSRLGQRARRRRSSSASLYSADVKHKLTASKERRIKIVGRFATPVHSPERTPTLTSYNSDDSSSDCSDLAMDIDSNTELDANDADDESDTRDFEKRGRSRGARQILASRV